MGGGVLTRLGWGGVGWGGWGGLMCMRREGVCVCGGVDVNTRARTHTHTHTHTRQHRRHDLHPEDERAPPTPIHARTHARTHARSLARTRARPLARGPAHTRKPTRIPPACPAAVMRAKRSSPPTPRSPSSFLPPSSLEQVLFCPKATRACLKTTHTHAHKECLIPRLHSYLQPPPRPPFPVFLPRHISPPSSSACI